MIRTVTTRTKNHRNRRLAAALSAATLAVTLAGSLPGTVPAAQAAPATPAETCTTPDFWDVSQGHTFYGPVTWLRCDEISTGYADGTYGPQREITRGEVAQLLFRYSGDTHQAGSTPGFGDVHPSHAAFTAISWMRAQGITTGYRNGDFGVDEPISRGELAAFLYRMSGEAHRFAPEGEPFTDMGSGDSFHSAAAWLKETGLVSGYADGSFRPGRDVTRGESAAFLYALETKLNGQPPVYEVPSRVVTSPSGSSGGHGGTYQNAVVAYNNGRSASTYRLYADHLDGRKPHGILIHLHGDGALEYTKPEWTAIGDYLKVAKEHDLMLVVPRTPDTTGSATWWEEKSSGQYAADLLTHLGGKYNLDLNQVYWTGYSGGAETITYQLVDAYSDRWSGGAAVMVGGGGASTWRQPLRPISAVLKRDFEMHWLAGADDTPSRGGASGGFDALKAARTGEAYYAKQGVRTTLTVKPGLDHWEIDEFGPAKLDEVLDAR